MITRFSLLLFSLIVLSHTYFHDWSYPKDLQHAIESSATFLRTITNPDGSFKYETRGDNATQEIPITYNSVRHAGTLFSLTLYLKYEWYTEHKLATGCREAAVLASEWLLGHITTPRDEETTFSDLKGFLMSKKTELDKNPIKENHFELGGNALSLLSLAAMNELHLINTDIEILRGMGRFILYMMDEQGDFPNHYFFQGKGFTKVLTCEYYPGEAALALVKLYAVDPDIKWLEASRDILKFLAKKHLEVETYILTDHWYLIATQHLFLYQDIISLPKDLLVACSAKFAYFVIENQRKNWCSQNAMFEGFVSTCLLFKYEFGLGHTYNGLYDGILDDLTPVLIDGTQKLITCQGKGGGLASNLNDVGTDNYLVRIDYNQHTMSCWIRTYEFLYEDYVPEY